MTEIKIFLLFIIISASKVINCDEQVPMNVDEVLKGQSLFYGFVTTAAEGPQDTLCSREMAMTAEGVVNKKRWALKMLDSSGVPESGLHWGNTYWLGNKIQCEATMSKKNLNTNPRIGPVTIETDESIPPFPISYYAAYAIHNSTLQAISHVTGEFRLTIGICIPASCKEIEVALALQKYFDLNLLYHQRMIDMNLEMESVKKIEDSYDWLWDPFTIILGIYMTITLSLVISGTIYDLVIYQPLIKSAIKANNSNALGDECDESLLATKKNVPPKINYSFKALRCFSLYANSKFLLSTKYSNESIKCIQGIKFFSMIHIVAGHTIYFLACYYKNRNYLLYIADEYFSQVFLSVHFSVDTFFCIGGYLMAYFLLKTCNGFKASEGLLKRMRMLINMISKRYIRIFPSYFMMILLSVVILKWRVNAMPFWLFDRDDIHCPKYWWRNLLFINTWSSLDERCLIWSWYLSNDMQFFIVCTGLIVLSSLYFKIAATLLLTLLLGSISLIAYLTYSEDYIPTLDAVYASRDVFYDRPWVRINPYIVGVIAAYIVFQLKKKLYINPHVLKLIWATWFVISYKQMFSYSNLITNLAVSMAYVSLSRTVWAICCAWVIIACETGNGGIMNNLLSMGIFIPFSKMAFWTFIGNPLTMFLIMSFSQSTLETNYNSNIAMTPGFILWAFVISFLCTLLFELPWTALTKLINDTAKSKTIKADEDSLKKEDNKLNAKEKSS